MDFLPLQHVCFDIFLWSPILLIRRGEEKYADLMLSLRVNGSFSSLCRKAIYSACYIRRNIVNRRSERKIFLCLLE